MNEMVATDGQTVTVAADLPYGKLGVSDFRTGSDGCGTTVNGIHAVRGHVVRQTAGTAYTTDYCDVLRCHTDLCHCLMQRSQEEVVTTPRTPPRLSFLIITCTIITHNSYSFLPQISQMTQILFFDLFG